MLLQQIKLAITGLHPDELAALETWLKNYPPDDPDVVEHSSGAASYNPGKTFLDESEVRRNKVIQELKNAEDYMVILVQHRDSNGRQPIAMHTSRQNKIGPALLTLIIQDPLFCEALGELVEEARLRRLGFTPNQLFP